MRLESTLPPIYHCIVVGLKFVIKHCFMTMINELDSCKHLFKITAWLNSLVILLLVSCVASRQRSSQKMHEAFSVDILMKMQ